MDVLPTAPILPTLHAAIFIGYDYIHFCIYKAALMVAALCSGILNQLDKGSVTTRTILQLNQ